jgi:hypothetical protein
MFKFKKRVASFLKNNYNIIHVRKSNLTVALRNEWSRHLLHALWCLLVRRILTATAQAANLTTISDTLDRFRSECRSQTTPLTITIPAGSAGVASGRNHYNVDFAARLHNLSVELGRRTDFDVAGLLT